MKNNQYSIILALLVALIGIFSSPAAHAYPDFIGYGYSSCVTCHYNSLGGGALNDYGRALFATEITARDVFSASKDEEEIGAQSGFLGSTQLPWWIRPGLKYRGLWLKMDPGSQSTTERFINMQNDVNITAFADKKQKYALVSTMSYTGQEPYYGKTNTWFAREYYARVKVTNNYWLYLGQMDKAYGIRNIDHTAVNRRAITLGQYDQSMGAILHVTYPDWDIALNYFTGNQAEEENTRQKGFSAVGEYQVHESLKVGGSVLSSKNESTEWNLLAGTMRVGLSKGSSIIAEAGVKQKKDLSTNADPQLGSYAWIETLINLRRGYNFLTIFEHSKNTINEPSPESLRLSGGFLFFPLPRIELRAMATNAKTYTETAGVPDAWALQGQVHVSY